MRFLRESTNTKPNTFRYHNLLIERHPEVYDPCEDSFLLLESLSINPQDYILELGTGSGLIALECARQGARVLCTDINPYAVQLTRRNIDRNRHLLTGIVDIRQGDLFSVIKKNEFFNIIIFNPPYLPTRNEEKIGGWFDIATDGGPNGLKVIKRFLEGFHTHLLPNGSAYFIFSSLSHRFTLEQYLKKQKLSAHIVARLLFDDEELDVYHISPTT